MKIVHIEDYFHPDAGYQINILPKYLHGFGHEQFIITSEMEKIPHFLTDFFGRDEIEHKDKMYFLNTGVKIIRLPLVAFISGRAIFDSKLKKTIKSINPDIIYIHGNDTLTGIRIFMDPYFSKYRIVTDSHMLEMASKNKFNKVFRFLYRRIITPIILKRNIPVIRTQNDDYVEKCLGVPLEKSPWISYGSDVLLFHPDDNVKKEFRQEYNIADNALIYVYAGKLDEAKGGALLASAFQEKISDNRQIVLVVVGNTVGEYGKLVDEKFAKSSNRIIRFGTQKYADLARFYQAGDVCVFAKQCSLSFYDAQACGLPVLSENNNINIDRCSHQNGWTFKSNDLESFKTMLRIIAEMDSNELKVMSSNSVEYIQKYYNYEAKAREYERIILGN